MYVAFLFANQSCSFLQIMCTFLWRFSPSSIPVVIHWIYWGLRFCATVLCEGLHLTNLAKTGDSDNYKLKQSSDLILKWLFSHKEEQRGLAFTLHSDLGGMHRESPHWQCIAHKICPKILLMYISVMYTANIPKDIPKPNWQGLEQFVSPRNTELWSHFRDNLLNKNCP